MSIQTAAPSARVSRLRQTLGQLHDEAGRLIQVFLASELVMRGSIYELRRKCGKPRCRCGAGELHSCMAISWTDQDGRKRLRSIPKGQLAEFQLLSTRYQRLRKARARLIEVHARMLDVIDKLEAARRKEP